MYIVKLAEEVTRFRGGKMRTTTKLFVLILALILLVVPVFGGCAKNETVQGKSVTVGMLQTSLIFGGALYDGFIDYVQYFNQQGGADGVKVKVVMHDTLMSPAEGAKGFRICEDAGAVLIACPMVTDAKGAAPLANQAKLPLLCSIASEAMLYPPAYAWNIAPTAGQDIGTFLHWVAEKDWDWEGKGRPPKILVWHFESGTQEDYVNIGEPIAKSLGLTWLDPEIYPFPFPMDWTPYMLRLREKNPDYVYGVIYELLTAAHDTGLAVPQGTKLCYFYGQTYVLAGDFGEKAIGCLSMQRWANIEDTNVPGIILMKELLAKNRRSSELNYVNYYNWGFVLGIAACELIQTAVQDAGYPVTKDAVVSALGKFDSNLMGMVGRVSFTPESRQGNTAVRILAVDENLKSVPLTDWIPTVPLEETLRALGMID
jgi:ABC-type branched-subunit amino acid transport system substrate-binding protein